MRRGSVTSFSLGVAVAFGVMLFSIGTTACAQPNDEARIRALEHRFAVAFKAKDVDGIMVNYEHSPDLAFFDVVPRRDHLGWDAYKKDWQSFLTSIGPIESFEVRDLTVKVDGNLAYGFSFQHYLAKTKAGAPINRTMRVTDVYRKTGRKWLIVQEHVSLPVDLRTGNADLQFKP